MFRKYFAKRRYVHFLMKSLVAVEVNGSLEVVPRAYADMYRDIGVGASKISFPARAPHQVLNAARTNVRADPRGLTT